MSLDTSDWGLTPEDDDFHEPDDSPWWTETCWFAWMVPERKLLGYFYPVFRPNLGIQAGGVLAFDDTAELPWELPAFDYQWHLQIPQGLDLRDAVLANGMTMRCTEPNRVFELGYRSRELDLALRVEGVVKPLVSRATPPFNKGHIDQICRVTGEMTLHGERIPVDCFAMRDRSWGRREDGRQPQVGYSYATHDTENAWLAVTIGKDHDYRVSTGFLIREGVWAELVDGQRVVRRDPKGRPVDFSLQATDRLGRSLEAEGSVLSRQVFTAYPSMFCWNSLVSWTGESGGYGEDQDVWHPRKWRRFHLSLTAQARA